MAQQAFLEFEEAVSDNKRRVDAALQKQGLALLELREVTDSVEAAQDAMQQVLNLHQELEPAVRREQVSDLYKSLADLSQLQQTLAEESSDLFRRVVRLEGAEAKVRIAFRSLKRILVLPPSSQQQPSPEQPSSSGQPSSSREPRFSPYGMRLPSLPDPHPSGFDSPTRRDKMFCSRCPGGAMKDQADLCQYCFDTWFEFKVYGPHPKEYWVRYMRPDSLSRIGHAEVTRNLQA